MISRTLSFQVNGEKECFRAFFSLEASGRLPPRVGQFQPKFVPAPTLALNHTGPVTRGPCKGKWGSERFPPLGHWPLISQTGEAELLFHVLFSSGSMLVTKLYLFPLGCVAWGCIKK